MAVPVVVPAPLLSSRVSACCADPHVARAVLRAAPLLTPLHAIGLGLGIGSRQCCGGCCAGEGGNFSEERKSASMGDRFRFDDFTHGQHSMEAGDAAYADANSKVPVLI